MDIKLLQEYFEVCWNTRFSIELLEQCLDCPVTAKGVFRFIHNKTKHSLEHDMVVMNYYKTDVCGTIHYIIAEVTVNGRHIPTFPRNDKGELCYALDQ